MTFIRRRLQKAEAISGSCGSKDFDQETMEDFFTFMEEFEEKQ